MLGESRGVRDGFLSAKSPQVAFGSGAVVVEPYPRKDTRSNCVPPLKVTELYCVLMEIPRRKERILIEIRRGLLNVWACIGDCSVRRAEAFHRMRDTRGDCVEPFLTAKCRLDASL